MDIDISPDGLVKVEMPRGQKWSFLIENGTVSWWQLPDSKHYSSYGRMRQDKSAESAAKEQL